MATNFYEHELTDQNPVQMQDQKYFAELQQMLNVQGKYLNSQNNKAYNNAQKLISAGEKEYAALTKDVPKEFKDAFLAKYVYGHKDADGNYVQGLDDIFKELSQEMNSKDFDKASITARKFEEMLKNPEMIADKAKMQLYGGSVEKIRGSINDGKVNSTIGNIFDGDSTFYGGWDKGKFHYQGHETEDNWMPSFPGADYENLDFRKIIDKTKGSAYSKDEAYKSIMDDLKSYGGSEGMLLMLEAMGQSPDKNMREMYPQLLQVVKENIHNPKGMSDLYEKYKPLAEKLFSQATMARAGMSWKEPPKTIVNVGGNNSAPEHNFTNSKFRDYFNSHPDSKTCQIDKKVSLISHSVKPEITAEIGNSLVGNYNDPGNIAIRGLGQKDGMLANKITQAWSQGATYFVAGGSVNRDLSYNGTALVSKNDLDGVGLSAEQVRYLVSKGILKSIGEKPIHKKDATISVVTDAKAETQVYYSFQFRGDNIASSNEWEGYKSGVGTQKSKIADLKNELQGGT